MGKEYKHSAEIELEFSNDFVSEAFASSVNAEIKDRGKVSIEQIGNVCIVKIYSKDVVALRALVNTVLRIASVVEKIEK